jgi:hypothetical protein
MTVPVDDKVLEPPWSCPTPSQVIPSPTPQTSPRARIAAHACTATGLIHTGTQWTKRHRQIIENRIDKRNFRMH